VTDTTHNYMLPVTFSLVTSHPRNTEFYIKVSKVVPVLLLTEHHAMMAYWGSGGIAPLIL
jgi:hypothetical protein